uniref:Uncharacterized protein n=1 Tax=viral metagenome TaxID=1070528 RepID=A0A6C0E065_9ZZZZ
MSKKKYKMVLPLLSTIIHHKEPIKEHYKEHHKEHHKEENFCDTSSDTNVKEEIVVLQSKCEEAKLIYDFTNTNISVREFTDCFTVDDYWGGENNYDSNDIKIIDTPSILKNTWFSFTLNIQISVINKTHHDLIDNKLIINLSGIFNNPKTITYEQGNDTITLEYSTNNETIILKNDFIANNYNMNSYDGVIPEKFTSIDDGIIPIGDMKGYGSNICNLVIKGYSATKLENNSSFTLECTLFSKIKCPNCSIKHCSICSYLKNKIPYVLTKKIALPDKTCSND